ncbi:hypothetical protein G6O69_32930 [Pseudenhygromyxa sp. WMMC2535]|uniref:hypothetical protein n=1 Tax=Pseudenhygromyxa sp. WMMC2535 TaxID=2712867 RepID=UPI001553FF70|nr:hypothetical protein [Pseudenhygromyxa sp. WMMC2535]NVB42673.1 hypothetical protein [Pseudenhygromyxa sp. WMMC2535]
MPPRTAPCARPHRGRSSSLRAWLSPSALVLGASFCAGVGLGCNLSGRLDEGGKSCGDGVIQDAEECDPKHPDFRYVACGDKGIAEVCDPLACELTACPECGNGTLDPGEECDGELMSARPCEQAGCTAECLINVDACPSVCGDGIIGIGEECDSHSSPCESDDDCMFGHLCHPEQGVCVGADDLSKGVECALFDVTASLVKDGYAQGEIGPCNDSCYWGRSKCSFCGDGEVDDAYQDEGDFSNDVQKPAEFCDGDQVSEAALDDYYDRCRELCGGGLAADLKVHCDLTCEDDCSSFDEAAGDDKLSPDALECCLEGGTLCPGSSPLIPDDIPCCAWLEAPETEGNCEFLLSDSNPYCPS